MSFSQLCHFQACLRSYLTEEPITTYSDIVARRDRNHTAASGGGGEMGDSFGGSLADSLMSSTDVPLAQSGLRPADLNTSPLVRYVKNVLVRM